MTRRTALQSLLAGLAAVLAWRWGRAAPVAGPRIIGALIYDADGRFQRFAPADADGTVRLGRISLTDRIRFVTENHRDVYLSRCRELATIGATNAWPGDDGHYGRGYVKIDTARVGNVFECSRAEVAG